MLYRQWFSNCEFDLSAGGSILKTTNAVSPEIASSPIDTGFVRLFEQQAEISANRTAVVCCGSRMSYSELNRRANRLARALRSQGVGKETVVGIYAERGANFLIGILACFKAGGAYLPMDIKYPARRSAQILKEAQVRHVLCDGGLGSDVAQIGNLAGIDGLGILEFQRDSAAEVNDDNLGLEHAPADLAYVIFTSGSTGLPKGAMIEHRGIVNHLKVKLDDLGINSADRILQNASQCFDISVWQFLSALLAGGEVHIVDNDLARDPRVLFDHVAEQKITIVEIVPSLLRAALDLFAVESPARRNLSALRWLVLTGEALPPGLCREWLKFYPGVPIINAYGPTECSDDVTHHKVSGPPPEDAIRVPIGRPVAHARLYIAEENRLPLQLCTQGSAGELYVGGLVVGRGYINNPEKTAQVFQPDPFSNEPDARLYRTGDLVRELPDGSLEYLGRTDRQVKVRGYRIELEEIEAVLRRYPGVKDCAVLARASDRVLVYFLDNEHHSAPPIEPVNEQKVLVAYVVSEVELDTSQVHEFLTQHLPPYMAPDQFIELPSLPLTPNGKLDVAALPNPRQKRPEQAYRAPKTDLDRKLCRLWQEVLGIDRVGIDDNFFALGGDSLTGVQILNRIRATMGTEVSFRTLIETPTIGQIATTIATAEQQKDVDAGSLQPSGAHLAGSTFPLTSGQQGLWFLWKIAPHNPYYSFQGILGIHGTVDLSALQTALRLLVERHSVLRTRFTERSGRPEQLICEPPAHDFPVIDFTHVAEPARPAALREAARHEVSRAFNLETETMFRAHVCRMSARELAVILTMHEIVQDAWATCVLIRELSELYAAAVHGTLERIQPRPLQYADFAVWEKRMATRELLANEGAYWRGALEGAPPLLELATDRPRPAQPTYRGDSIGTVLSPEASKRIKDLSAQESATLFMTLLAAYNILLQAYSGQDDIVVGAPNAGRDQGDIEDLLGYFIAMLPIRTKMEGDPTFREVLRRTRQSLTGAMNNARYPFIWIVEDQKIQRDTRYQPVFQVMLDMLNFPKVPIASEGIAFKFDELDVGYKKYDIELYAHEQGDQIYIRLSYLLDLFDRETIERMLKNYAHILEQAVAAPDRRISAMEILSPDEHNLVLMDFNGADLKYPQEILVQELFEEQVRRTPEATAFIADGNSISFSSLNERSNRLARYLRESGIHRNVRVAICLRRGVEEIVAMLAVLKSGGAYVPLDPDYPAARLEELAAEAQCSHLVSDHEQVERLRFEGRKVLIDRDAQRIADFSPLNPGWKNGIDDLLTIMSTSSSTGKSKATLIAHRGVLNRIHGMWHAYPFVAGDITASMRSTALATHFWEIYGGLLRGIPTVLIGRDEVLQPSILWRRLEENRVSYFTASPSLLDLLVRQAERNGRIWPDLRFVVSGGEAMSLGLCERWKRAFPAVRFINVYGTTESSATVTSYDTVQMPQNAPRIPIGKPYPNLQVHIMDSLGRLAPIGAVGELLIGGEGVCHGYLDNPTLNAETFFPDPFSKTLGRRLFRTRDLGRYTNGGCIEVVGRLDHQVKVRGFRVDLAEVEATLRKHPQVSHGACITFDDGGYKAIAAYYVSEHATPTEKIQEWMAERLPHYMVPQRFMRLHEMPATSSGKIAYRELPPPLEIVPEKHASEEAPLDEIEAKLIDIWKVILKVNNIGPNDNFFALGGHSLAAAEMSAHIQQALKAEVSIATLYQGAATVKRLAGIIRQATASVA
jgi:surfactin family lipopeptide synthetase A